MLLTGLALACAACSQEDAPAEQVAEAAESLVAPSPEPALAKGRWAPQDTCHDVEGADLFRSKLESAIKARDAEIVATLAAEDVMLDFGGGAGRAELMNRLNDESTGLWAELDTLMTLGCSANEQGGITIPWYFDQDLGVDDPFESWLVAGEDVPVTDGPGDQGKRIGLVSWDVVQATTVDPQAPTQQVILADGMSGYIATDKLRSLVDYRLVASSRNGRWRITSLLAGD